MGVFQTTTNVFSNQGDAEFYGRISDIAKSHHKIKNYVAATGYHARKIISGKRFIIITTSLYTIQNIEKKHIIMFANKLKDFLLSNCVYNLQGFFDFKNIKST